MKAKTQTILLSTQKVSVHAMTHIYDRSHFCHNTETGTCHNLCVAWRSCPCSVLTCPQKAPSNNLSTLSACAPASQTSATMWTVSTIAFCLTLPQYRVCTAGSNSFRKLSQEEIQRARNVIGRCLLCHENVGYEKSAALSCYIKWEVLFRGCHNYDTLSTWKGLISQKCLLIIV